MNLNFLSYPAGRIGFAVVFAAVVFVVGRSVFREPQTLCVTSVDPGYVFASSRGDFSVTTEYVPTAFIAITGRHDVSFGPFTDGSYVAGTLTVSDSARPVLSLGDNVPEDFVRVEWCGAFAESDAYVVADDGVITAYQKTSQGDSMPAGFTLTASLRNDIAAPMNALVSPNGMYVAYIIWDEEKYATVLGVAEVSGKNNVVLAELTPEQGEMVLNELSWSGSKKVVYAEVVPMTDGPDKHGNMHEKTLYEVNVSTHVRGGIHLDAVP